MEAQEGRHNFELTHLTKACIVHSLHALSAQEDSAESASKERVEKFCRDLREIVSQPAKYSIKKRQPSALLQASDSESHSLNISSTSVEEFCEGKLVSVDEFSQEVERNLTKNMRDEYFDHDALFRVCWKVYRERSRPDKQVTEFFRQHPPDTDDSTYHLWLIFNAVLSPLEGSNPGMVVLVKCLDVIMKRVIELCGHDCSSQELAYSTKSGILTYTEFLKAIANYNEIFELKPTLMTEVVQDLKDEIVDAVLKKSYLTKKGHVLKTWKRRWFVLRKTIMRYFESKEKPVLKGQMVLNSKTKVREIPDQGKRKHCFEVICGETSKPYLISADDEKSRHDWILAIKKAIELAARVCSDKEDTEDAIESPTQGSLLSNFYRIKFRTSESIIPKSEGAVRHLCPHEVCQQDVSEDEEEKTSSPLLSPTDSVRSRSKSATDMTIKSKDVLTPISLVTSSGNVAGSLTASDSFIMANQGGRPAAESITSPFPPGFSPDSFITRNVYLQLPLPSDKMLQEDAAVGTRDHEGSSQLSDYYSSRQLHEPKETTGALSDQASADDVAQDQQSSTSVTSLVEETSSRDSGLDSYSQSSPPSTLDHLQAIPFSAPQ